MSAKYCFHKHPNTLGLDYIPANRSLKKLDLVLSEGLL
jgi:hypothetical protein